MPARTPRTSAATRRFAHEMIEIYAHGLLAVLVALGHRLRLFETLAQGAGTSEEIAQRAGLEERYVREWLSALACGGLLRYDAAARRFSLPRSRAECLSGPSPYNVAPASDLLPLSTKNLSGLARAFRRGGGVAQEEFLPEFPRIMDDLGRRRYDAALIEGYLPLVGGLSARLRRGARVADVGCGTGHALNLMAEAFPRSEFLGFDRLPSVLETARSEARARGLRNVRFELRDATKLPPRRFHLVTMFDSLHDQAKPAAVLTAAREALRPRGVLLAVEPKASSRLEENIGKPEATYLYGLSVVYCLTVSLAERGAGLGTAWGTELAHRMFQEAGFDRVETFNAPLNSLAVVYAAYA